MDLHNSSYLLFSSKDLRKFFLIPLQEDMLSTISPRDNMGAKNEKYMQKLLAKTNLHEMIPKTVKYYSKENILECKKLPPFPQKFNNLEFCRSQNIVLDGAPFLWIGPLNKFNKKHTREDWKKEGVYFIYDGNKTQKIDKENMEQAKQLGLIPISLSDAENVIFKTTIPMGVAIEYYFIRNKTLNLLQMKQKKVSKEPKF